VNGRWQQHRSLVAYLLFFSLLGMQAHAHHSNSAYDMSDTLSVSGTVVDLQWRNPHVLIDLEVDDGAGGKEVWVLETVGIQNLIRNGWTKVRVGAGENISAEVRPTNSGEPGGILRWVTLADGTVLPIDDDAPDYGPSATTNNDAPSADIESISVEALAADTRADWLARRASVAEIEALTRPDALPVVSETSQPGAMDPQNLAANQGNALFDVTGVWKFRFDREYSQSQGGEPWDFLPLPTLTPKAQEIYDDVWEKRRSGENYSDPTAYCYPPGMPRLMTRVGNSLMFQTSTAIFMIHRYNNDYRTIYLDGREHVDPSVRIDSYNGDSVGIWEDDTLFVDTVGFGQKNHFVQAGIPIGVNGRVTERWRMINDGNTIEIEYRMTDPDYWEGEWIDTKFLDRIYGEDVLEGNCIALEDADIAGLASLTSVPTTTTAAEQESSAGVSPDSARSMSMIIPIAGGLLAGLLIGFVWFRRGRN